MVRAAISITYNRTVSATTITEWGAVSATSNSITEGELLPRVELPQGEDWDSSLPRLAQLTVCLAHLKGPLQKQNAIFPQNRL